MPLSEITREPRKYGFHGTIKPPFYLAEGQNLTELKSTLGDLCKQLKPVQTDGLRLSKLGRFLALTVEKNPQALSVLSSSVLSELATFRAPVSFEDLRRRRQSNLSARQDFLLVVWGYPYVLEEYHFHITLTGKLRQNRLKVVHSVLEAAISELQTAPFTLDALSLVGEDEVGQFHEIARFSLSG